MHRRHDLALLLSNAVDFGRHHCVALVKGSIEVGKLADFLALYTVLNGYVYDGESATRVWPNVVTVPRGFWQTAEESRRFAVPVPKALK